MKKIAFTLLATGCIFFYSCGDNGDTKETKSVESTTTIKQNGTTTEKTNISIGKDGASYENKKGNGVSVDKKGVNVKTRDVNIDIGSKKDTLR